MKTFKVKETKPALHVWYYTVQAETEQQAIEMVQDGDIEADEYELEDVWYDPQQDGDFEVEEDKSVNQ